jgi:hypothetical protein
MMWCGEVADNRELCFEAFVGMELGTVIEGYGFEEVGFGGQDSTEGRVGLSRGSVADLCSSCQARLSFHEGEDAFEVAGSHDSVSLPMTELGPVLGSRRAF